MMTYKRLTPATAKGLGFRCKRPSDLTDGVAGGEAVPPLGIRGPRIMRLPVGPPPPPPAAEDGGAARALPCPRPPKEDAYLFPLPTEEPSTSTSSCIIEALCRWTELTVPEFMVMALEAAKAD